jgi:hypothetical protein
MVPKKKGGKREDRGEREREGESMTLEMRIYMCLVVRNAKREKRLGNATTLKMRIEKREKREDQATQRRQERRQRRERRQRESMTLEMRIYKRRERRKRTGQRGDDIWKKRRCNCPEHERA